MKRGLYRACKNDICRFLEGNHVRIDVKRKLRAMPGKHAEGIHDMATAMKVHGYTIDQILFNVCHDIDGVTSRHPMFIPRYRRMDYSVQEGFGG